MKKFISLLLCVLMIASMSVTAFAAGSDDLTDEGAVSGNSSGDVNVTIGDGTTTKTIYYVVITWKSMDFNFQFDNSQTIVWDTTNHKYTYEDGTDLTGTWSSTSVEDAITVVNHSNTEVAIEASFDGVASAETNGVTATVDLAGKDANGADNTGIITIIKSAEGVGTDADSLLELTATYDVSVNESDVPTSINKFTVGTITVQISNP